jgi:Transglutaminase-like superfamily
MQLKTHLRSYFGLPSAERAALRWAWILILISKSLLPIVRLPRLKLMIERMVTPGHKSASIQSVSPQRLAEIIEIAGHRTFGSTCLHRSLALLVLLRRQSTPARLAIGVNKENGFAAHAWVEVRTEAPVHCHFARLLEYEF